MSLADVAMQKVKAQVTRRRLRLDDFFADFDRLHTGRLTTPQFARVLALTHANLSEAEVAALAAAFSAKGKSAVKTGSPSSAASATQPAATMAATATAPAAAAVSTATPCEEVGYTAFLAALRERDAPGAAKTTFLGSRFNPGAAGVHTSPLTQQEEDMIRPIVQMLRHAIRSRGIALVPPFRDMDPLNTGLVTASQFERCLPMHGQLRPEVVKLFAKKYGDGSGNVVYMRWCQEVDDTLRKGEQTGALRDAAGTAGVNGDGSRFNVLGSFGVSTYANPNLTAPELVRILREQSALYRLRCDDFLTDFDKFKTGTVSAAQFESALGRLKLVKFALTQENIATLVAAYAEKAGGAHDVTLSGGLSDAVIRVHYTSFLFDINPKNFDATSEIDIHNTAAVDEGGDAMATTATRDHTSRGAALSYYATTHAPDTFLTDEAERKEAARVLEKVSRLVRTNRIFLSPVLRDFDRVRKAIYEHRTCTSSRFARGLATQNLMLPPEELRVLIKKYTVPSVDGTPSDDVNYYQFVQDVDPSQACVPAGQQPPSGGVLTDTLAAGRASVAVPRAATPLDVILEKIALQCVEKELRVGEFFADFDPLRSGTLLPSHFITALTIAGIADLSEAEWSTLVAAFPSPKVRGSVDGHAFLREMGAYAPLSVPSSTMTGTARTGRHPAVGSATPNITTINTTAAAATSRPPPVTDALSATEQATLAQILKRLRHDVKAHNALLLPFFADFDRSGRGKITHSNFRQALARHRFPLSDADTALLCRVYTATTPGGAAAGANVAACAGATSEATVEYRRFVRDVSDEGVNNYTTTAAAASDNGGASTIALGATGGAKDSRIANADGCDPHNTMAASASTSVEEALGRVCCFLQERQPRLGEFFPDGDELRHGRVTRARFRHCLSMLGLGLSEAELQALEEGFAMPPSSPGTSTHAPKELQEVDYPSFLATVRELLAAGLGASAVHERRRGQTTALFQSMQRSTDGKQDHLHRAQGDDDDAMDEEGGRAKAFAAATQAETLLAVTLARVRRGLAARRATTLPAFREYDRTRRGFVKEGQFFACLMAVLGVPLTPLESSVITKAFSLGNGEMGYIRFADEVDSAEFAGVS